MATSAQLREWWKNYRCSPDKMVRVAFPGPDRMWNLLVAAEAAQAFEVFAEVMAATGYLFRESAGGTYNCRKISGTDQWSLHAYGIAIDLNPSKNPYGKPLRYDYPQEFLDGVASIVTSTGVPAFKWGGLWNTPDAMHFEIDVAPTTLSGGVTWPREDDMRVKEFVLGMQAHPERIDRLVDAGVIGPKKQATKDYWRGLLASPDDPAWLNFVNALEVQTAILASRQASLPTFKITGEAEPER